MYRTVFWTLWEKARVGCFKKTTSKHVYYLGWNRSPAQVGCMRQAVGPGALGRPRGIGWRGRWEGRSGWGTLVNPCLIHFNVWQNPLQLKKKREIHKKEQTEINKGSQQELGLLSSTLPWTPLVAQTTMNMSAVREICVQSLGWEDPLEANGSHSSILGWEIPWTEQPGGLQSMGLQESDMT